MSSETARNSAINRLRVQPGSRVNRGKKKRWSTASRAPPAPTGTSSRAKTKSSSLFKAERAPSKNSSDKNT